jgi:TIGR03009 family protein
MPRYILWLVSPLVLSMAAHAAWAQGEGRPSAGKPRPMAGPRRIPAEDQAGGEGQAEGGSRPPAEARPAAPRAPKAPFKLTADQQVEVDAALVAWEQRSKTIKTLKAEFTRWEYDTVFGKMDDQGNPIPVQKQGLMKYSAPDKGLYQVLDEGGEHWVCDGRSIFEFNHGKKQLIERVLPPELQGKAISDGPLPFLFGAEAEKLKRRYFIRLVTPSDVEGQVWLEGYPRYPGDAANFQRATLILDARTMLPFAIEIFLPNGKSRTVHQFDNQKVNDPLGFLAGDFSKPKLPRGWTRVVEDPAGGAQPSPGGARPAARPAAKPASQRPSRPASTP